MTAYGVGAAPIQRISRDADRTVPVPRPIQTFQVGIKGFVWNEDRLLRVQETNDDPAPRAPRRARVGLLVHDRRAARCVEARGEIALSHEHMAYQWVARDGWDLLPLAPGYQAALTSFFAGV